MLLLFPSSSFGKDVWSPYSYTHCSVIHPDLRSLLAISHLLFIIIPDFFLFLPSSPPTQSNHPLKCSVLLFSRFSKLALSPFPFRNAFACLLPPQRPLAHLTFTIILQPLLSPTEVQTVSCSSTSLFITKHMSVVYTNFRFTFYDQNFLSHQPSLNFRQDTRKG